MDRPVTRFANGRGYWLFLIVLGLTLEGVALFYQYVLDYQPCVLCIHVRMLVAALIVVALAMLALCRLRAARVAGHLAAVAILVWLTERSWQLLATERGWIFGSCDMQSGLPEWLALERWFPFIFRIHEPCGYTPDMPFGLTMAETLIALNGALGLLAVIMLVLACRRGKATTAG